jgi:two-component system, cell cycle sensor histidine kinase and response regulator CckA
MVWRDPKSNTMQRDVAVLVLDDETMILNLVSAFLRGTRFLPILAGDVNIARRICEETELTIDIVLSDLSMPGRGAEAFWTSLRNRFPEARVIFMSGFAEDQVELPDWGGRRLFLEKPFTAAELVKTLERAGQNTMGAGGS